MTIVLAGTLAEGGKPVAGWVEVEGERIAATGRGAPPRAPDVRAKGLVAPGLCDLQVNGAGGCEAATDPAAVDQVLLARGVTSYLATVLSAEDSVAAAAVARLAERAADPASPLAGVHLEGPFLSAEHAGMHPPARLRAPAGGVPEYVFSPAVRLVTLAPELPGAIELIGELRRRGVTVALGHSGASADVARRAVDAGARMVTHLFNAMAPLHHRAPGLVGVALADGRVSVCVIADGLHVDPLVLEVVRRAAGERVVLVSDASPAAAASAGRYRLAGVELERGADGAVRTPAGRLAGSALTLDAAVRNWAALTEATPAEALRAGSETPAAAVCLEAGLHPGRRADLVLLDEAGAVRRTMRAGRWVA